MTQRVKVYKSEDGGWRWTYWKSSDKVATSGESYVNRAHAVDMATSMFPDAELEVVGDGDDE